MCDVTHSQSILSSIGIQQSLDGWLVHTCDMTHEFMCLTWLFRVCDIICVTRRIHVCDITRSCVRQDDMCDVTHSHVWRVEFVCVIWCTHMFHMTHLHVRHDSFIQPIHVCDMTHSCVWHDSFICVTWRTHLCDMTHSCVWHDSFMCVPWLIHMTHSCVWHDALICVTQRIYTCDLTHAQSVVSTIGMQQSFGGFRPTLQHVPPSGLAASMSV